jgi:uncharacterized small protein (DUF1192 family)
MKKITHEGETYILQSDMERVIGERVKKYATRAATADESIKELQTRIDEQSKSSSDVNLLREKIENLEGQLTKSQQRYTRHSAISTHGITSPEVVELIEWSYEKTMAKRAKKDKVQLGDWLNEIITDPGAAPLTLRPHLPQQQQQQQTEQQTAPDMPEKTQQQYTPAQINTGAIKTPENTTLGRLSDTDYYRSNREAIRKQFYAQYKKG